MTPINSLPDVIAGDVATYSWDDVDINYSGEVSPAYLESTRHADPSNTTAIVVTALSMAWRAKTLGDSIFWIDVADRVLWGCRSRCQVAAGLLGPAVGRGRP